MDKSGMSKHLFSRPSKSDNFKKERLKGIKDVIKHSFRNHSRDVASQQELGTVQHKQCPRASCDRLHEQQLQLLVSEQL